MIRCFPCPYTMSAETSFVGCRLGAIQRRPAAVGNASIPLRSAVSAPITARLLRLVGALPFAIECRLPASPNPYLILRPSLPAISLALENEGLVRVVRVSSGNNRKQCNNLGCCLDLDNCQETAASWLRVSGRASPQDPQSVA